MIKWEYHEMTLAVGDAVTTSALTLAGAGGWELIDVDRTHKHRRVYLFKRPKPEKTVVVEENLNRRHLPPAPVIGDHDVAAKSPLGRALDQARATAQEHARSMGRILLHHGPEVEWLCTQLMCRVGSYMAKTHVDAAEDPESIFYMAATPCPECDVYSRQRVPEKTSTDERIEGHELLWWLCPFANEPGKGGFSSAAMMDGDGEILFSVDGCPICNLRSSQRLPVVDTVEAAKVSTDELVYRWQCQNHECNWWQFAAHAEEYRGTKVRSATGCPQCHTTSYVRLGVHS